MTILTNVDINNIEESVFNKSQRKRIFSAAWLLEFRKQIR